MFHLATGQALLIHHAMLLRQFKETFRQGEAGLHRHLVAGKTFAEGLDRAVRACVHLHREGLCRGLALGSITPPPHHRHTAQGNH
jgi:hypothetical protein